MATASPLNVMTLGPQQKAMSSLMQPTASNAGCVMVGGPQGQPAHLSPHQAASKAVLLQQRRALAPADARGAVVMAAAAPAANASASDMLRCKRRINFSHNPHLTYAPGHQPASVARRNARERNRVKQVNNGFATLRSRIPVSVAAALSSAASPAPSGGRGASKKLSKVETLRMAVEYIRSLQQLLEDHATETASTASSSGSSTTPEPSGGALSAAAGSDTGYYSSSPESGVALLAGTHYAGPAAPVGPAPPHPLLAPPSMPLAGTQLSPPCSEASSSPTPSYASEGSGSAGSAYAPPSVYQQDTYENYEPMSPEDEELLDVISWWQQSQ